VDQDRHSIALEADLITDEQERARREAANGLLLYDAVVERVEYWLDPERPFRLRPSSILDLHRTTLDGISSYAGLYRPAGIEIKGSKHLPPGAHLVPSLIEDLCDYVNDARDASPLHLAAYVLWKLNWIHPFTDGNGRTARAVAYLVLCVRSQMRLPGVNTVMEQIASNKSPYYRALEAADAVSTETNVNVDAMEQYLTDLFANQLASVYEAARTAKS
jgi:Fic family protein